MGRGHHSSASWGRGHWGGRDACGGRSYHDGGVGGGRFGRWYENHLSGRYGGQGKGGKHWQDEEDRGGEDGTGGTGGSGGSKGSGGTSGTWGSGGSGGTRGKGHGGKRHWWHREEVARGTGGSGTGGSGGSGSGGSKGSGSGRLGTGGSGTGGSGTGGSGTSGSGTSGSGTGGSGTYGTGTGGTKGGDGGGDGSTDGKTSILFEIGGGTDPSVTVEVLQTPEGQLFIKMEPTSWEGEVADIDGLFFNMTDDASLEGLNFFPDENALPVTGHAAEANAVNALDTGTTVPGSFDGMVQFGQAPDSTDGTVTNANFTLWSDNGPLTLDDIDLSSMSLVVSSPDGSQQVLEGGYDPNVAASGLASYANGGVGGGGLEGWYDSTLAGHFPGSGGSEGEPETSDILALMTQPAGTSGSGAAGSEGLDEACEMA